MKKYFIVIIMFLQMLSSNIYVINSVLLTEHKANITYIERFTHSHSHIHEAHQSLIDSKHQHKHSHGKKLINISDFVAHSYRIDLTNFLSSNDLFRSIDYWIPNPTPNEIFRPPKS